ncbi:MAG: hypothetical protein HY520_02615 [Candidatus Aenigmarchaeota archaeon]|nr:hypothetical protein [Candidatus Aenigmarchaeota archaeon]
MKLVVDTNVLFSFFVKSSTTREMISDFRTFDELRKHSATIRKKAKISEAEFEEMLEYLQAFVASVSLEVYEDKLREASEVCPDPNDVDFFALAITLDCDIWSNEEKLKKQTHVNVFTTKDLVKRFGFYAK